MSIINKNTARKINSSWWKINSPQLREQIRVVVNVHIIRAMKNKKPSKLTLSIDMASVSSSSMTHYQSARLRSCFRIRYNLVYSQFKPTSMVVFGCQ